MRAARDNEHARAQTRLFRSVIFISLARGAISWSIHPPQPLFTLPRPRSPGVRLLEVDEEVVDLRRPFGDLLLQPAIMDALGQQGINAPTEIQAASSMAIHRGGHTLLHSETGSGKTLAYLLPLVAQLHVSRPNQLLIVVPSRELALQTASVIERAWPHHGTQRAFVLAGSPPPTDAAEQVRVAACPILVATPRPLLGLVRHLAGTDRLHSRKSISASGAPLASLFSRLKAVVLDEADALLLDRDLAMAPPR